MKTWQALGRWFYVPVFTASSCGTFPTCVYTAPMGDRGSQGLLSRKSVSSVWRKRERKKKTAWAVNSPFLSPVVLCAKQLLLVEITRVSLNISSPSPIAHTAWEQKHSSFTLHCVKIIERPQATSESTCTHPALYMVKCWDLGHLNYLRNFQNRK